MSLVAGINSSTQSLSCVVIDLDAEQVVYRDKIEFGKTLGDKYGVKDGFMDNCAGWVHSPPLMWVQALDLMCDRMAKELRSLSQIKAIAGSGQQHGTVYLNKTARTVLSNLDASATLTEQLSGIFSRPTSPIWRDSSTAEDCDIQAATHGGRMSVAEVTGSVPTRRFSGPQIHKFARTEPAAFEATSHVALVSSFMCSLLLGDIAPIDYGDGAGMNLMDIRKHTWLDNAFGANEISAAIKAKLPSEPVPSTTVVGQLNSYYVNRFGFEPGCQVLAFSGDNPDSLLGMGVFEPGKLVISLGTSDTNFCMIPEAKHDPNGFANVFGAVTGGYMALSCFANGGLTRKAIRDRFELADWDAFSDVLRNSPAGNGGKVMIPFLAAEITPVTDGPVEAYFGGLSDDDRAGCVRGVVEGLLLNMFQHSDWMGQRPSVIWATGGGAQNREILQVCADVFNATVHQFEIDDSVSLGAALRAANSIDTDWTWERLTGLYCKSDGDPVRPQDPGAYEDLKGKFGGYLANALAK